MWQTIFIEPLYNVLILITNTLWGSLALGVIALTLIIKLILGPLTIKALRAQRLQQQLKPKIDELRTTITDQVGQSKALMALYKEHGASPFSGCLPILIQIPIILALYTSLLAASQNIHSDLLYSGLTLSNNFSEWFFSVNLFEKSILIVLLAGLTQYIQQSLAPVMISENDPTAPMMKIMRYTLPVMIGFFAAAVPAAVALYWTVSNAATIAIETLFRKVIDKS